MKNKTIFSLLFSSIFAVSTIVSSFAAGISIKINGKVIDSDVEPQIIEGRTMVPVRAIFEGVGAEVSWDASTKTITGTKDSVTVKMKIGEKTLSINDKNIEMDASPAIIEDRTYAPARYVAESFGFDVSWNGDLKEVSINSKITATTEVTTETTTELTTKTETTTEITTKTVTTTETSTETTTLSAAEILNSSPVKGVGAATYKLIKNDILNAFKVYYVGNSDNNNRFQKSTYNKLMSVWDSTAQTEDEKTFVIYAKQVYQNMVTTCKKIDQRKAKYPSNANIATYCTDRKDKLEVQLKEFLYSEDIETAKKKAEQIKNFAANTVAS